MQVVKRDYYKNMSENNRIRLKTIKATRGMIYDESGEILIDNYPYFNLAVIPENVKDFNVLLETLSSVINIDIEFLKEKINEAKGKPSFKPIVLMENLSDEDLAKIEANRLKMPGIEIMVESIRYYPYKMLASHIVGYLSEIDSVKIKLDKYKDYKPGDLVGNSGIEKSYEKILRGKDGLKEVEVDVLGREIAALNVNPAKPGSSIYLSINVKLQKFIEEAFEGESGAVVVMNVNNGQLLSFFSKPNFDPSLFVKGISAKDWKVLSEDSLHPLQNKAISGQYSPGSIFKLVMATAALEEGVIAKNSAFKCTGTYKVGNSKFSCWKKWGHGDINLVDAIEQSCDVYFYNLGSILGVDTIAKYAHKFGLGEATGIDLEYEKLGLIPTTEWKRKALKAPWYSGETISVSIGQSYVLVTPLQLAVYFAAIANGKSVLKPQLLNKIENADGTVIQEASPVVRKELSISQTTLETLREGLFAVMNGERGTARGASPNNIKAAGKTGTVQVYSEKKATIPREEELPFELRDHAWFVCYAPAKEPEVVISIIVEHGGHGGSAAAPIAKKIMDYYFNILKAGKEDV